VDLSPTSTRSASPSHALQGLVDVDLSGNGITSEGAALLALGVAESQSLAALVLDNNDIR